MVKPWGGRSVMCGCMRIFINIIGKKKKKKVQLHFVI